MQGTLQLQGQESETQNPTNSKRKAARYIPGSPREAVSYFSAESSAGWGGEGGQRHERKPPTTTNTALARPRWACQGRAGCRREAEGQEALLASQDMIEGAVCAHGKENTTTENTRITKGKTSLGRQALGDGRECSPTN